MRKGSKRETDKKSRQRQGERLGLVRPEPKRAEGAAPVVGKPSKTKAGDRDVR